MEKLFLRFGHLGEEIFDSLDDKSLSNCKKVGKTWNSFITNKKFFWIRFIMRHNERFSSNHTNCHSRWTKIFQKNRLEDIKEFAKECRLEMAKKFSISEFVAPFVSACINGKLTIGKSKF